MLVRYGCRHKSNIDEVATLLTLGSEANLSFCRMSVISLLVIEFSIALREYFPELTWKWILCRDINFPFIFCM